jgi:hypothetical protein
MFKVFYLVVVDLLHHILSSNLEFSNGRWRPSLGVIHPLNFSEGSLKFLVILLVESNSVEFLIILLKSMIDTTHFQFFLLVLFQVDSVNDIVIFFFPLLLVTVKELWRVVTLTLRSVMSVKSLSRRFRGCKSCGHVVILLHF